jgi:hypothetical protein
LVGVLIVDFSCVRDPAARGTYDSTASMQFAAARAPSHTHAPAAASGTANNRVSRQNYFMTGGSMASQLIDAGPGANGQLRLPRLAAFPRDPIAR